MTDPLSRPVLANDPSQEEGEEPGPGWVPSYAPVLGAAMGIYFHMEML